MESKTPTDILREEYENLKNKYRELYINYNGLDYEAKTNKKGVCMELHKNTYEEILSVMPLAEIPAYVYDIMCLFDGYADIEFSEVVTKIYNSTLREVALFVGVLLETYELNNKMKETQEEEEDSEGEEEEENSDQTTLFSYLSILDN